MKNKRGSGSIFLAIILAALIFVEGIYLALIIDINRRISIERALRLQVEAILTKYNEELFDNYGLYGFLIDDVDDYVFKKALNSTGYEYGEDIFIYGYRTISTVQLRDAISNYYAYRSPGIVLNGVFSIFQSQIDTLKENSFFKNIRRFKASSGNKVLTIFTKSLENVTEILSSDELAEIIEISDSDNQFVEEFFELYQSVNDSEIDFDDDFSPKDMFSMDFFNATVDLFDTSSEIIEDDLFNVCLSHYCVYNFECCVKSFSKDGVSTKDCNLHGTKYEDLNSSRCNDAEYLITGFTGSSGKYAVGYMIFPMIMIAEIVNCITDKEFMDTVKVIAEILSYVIAIFLEGAKIPDWVFEMIIVMYFSLFKALTDLDDIYEGESISLFDDTNEYGLSLKMNYKDFMYLYSLLVNKENKLMRLDELLTQKYGDFLTCIEIGTTYRNEEFYAEMGYELYGF